MAKKKSWNEIKSECSLFHQGKYDYSKSIYINYTTKIEIICPEHGSFFQTPQAHKKMGCRKCGRKLSADKQKYSDIERINKANKVHQNKYDYSKSKYINSKTKIEIICPEHGSFFQLPSAHLAGSGCPKCKANKIRNTKAKKQNRPEVIKKLSRINPQNDYSLINYKNQHELVDVICPEHGIFKQTISNGLLGHSCPRCNSSKGENYIRNYLLENSYTILEQYSFKDSSIKNLRFDFYIPEFNLAIEYDGIQHFKAIDYFGGDEVFLKIKKRDEIKNQYCKDNNINLLRIPYWEFHNIDKILSEKIEYIYYRGI
jgi:very-short-patch-repair endonuclease/predicted  nucleic acid-binding Zn-ribbon protein